MKPIRLEYKKETGNRPEEAEFNNYFTEEYVEWLEDMITELQGKLSVANANYKDEYDHACYEIGQLQEQLIDAEQEIRELSRLR